jgi:hypothetical protein
VHGGSGWQFKVFLSAMAVVAAIICIPYALRVAFELCRPFIWVFYILLIAAFAGIGFIAYRRWHDGEWY